MNIAALIVGILILTIIVWIIYRMLVPRGNMLSKEEGASDFEDEGSWQRFSFF